MYTRSPSRTLLLIAGLALALPVLTNGGCRETTRPDGEAGPLAQGAEVPALSATDHRGESVSLRALQGQTYVVYFYPRDGTPGCTKEACAFRDAWTRYDSAGVGVLGVSADSADSHRKFAEEHQLPFALIADEDHAWASAFGVRLGLGMTERISFLIGPDGRVAKVYPGVDPGVHAKEVLEDAAGLN